MKIYIVFETQESDFNQTYDVVVKVFADEDDAARLATNNKYYWYDEFYVE